MLETVTPVTGKIHSVGASKFNGSYSKWSTISIRQTDGSMLVRREVETRDVMTPEVRPDYSGTFYFWNTYIVAVRHDDGRLIDACYASVIAVQARQIGLSVLSLFFVFGIVLLPFFIFFGPSPRKVQEQVIAHARLLDQAA